jgi:hypothetical protein
MKCSFVALAMDKAVEEYLAKIGAKGGKKSKRVLTLGQARKMVEARERKKKNRKGWGDG